MNIVNEKLVNEMCVDLVENGFAGDDYSSKEKYISAAIVKVKKYLKDHFDDEEFDDANFEFTAENAKFVSDFFSEDWDVCMENGLFDEED